MNLRSPRPASRSTLSLAPVAPVAALAPIAPVAALAALAALAAPADLPAQTLRVSVYGADGNPGDTWGSSLRSLREALARAATDPSVDRIEIGAGTYKPGGLRGMAFDLRSGLTIVGGYPAAGGSTPDAEANPTILSGDIGVAGDSSDNSYSVLVALGVIDVRLEGLRIRDGRADDATAGGPWTHGGALYAQNSTLLFADCRFVDNFGRYGGAVSLWSCSATFSGCRFRDNLALDGGAIANLTLEQSGDVLVDRCRFLGNHASSFGGAIWNCARLAAYDSVFSGNSAGDHGGAVCSVTQAHETRLANCSCSNNEAAIGGGAFYAFDPGVTVLVNSIFWNDLGGGAPTEIAPAGVPAHHCDVQGLAACALSGYANIEADPRFLDALGPDGTAGTPDDDLHLRRSSPCLQVGDNAAVPIFAMLDIDDEDRVQSPLALLPAIVDVGADEVGPLRILFAGSAADLDLDVAIDGSTEGIGDTDAMAVPGGSRLEATLRSPGGSQNGSICAMTLDVFAGSMAPSVPGLPGTWFGPGAVVLLFPSLPAQGLPLMIDPMPPALTGSLMLQGHVLSHSAPNGLFESSRGRELRMQ